MKASDFIVEYLIHEGITDVFGYPGGMVTHFMDSISRYTEKITAHTTYHEQGAAFAACGYAQASGKVGVAYATSGPGATNLVTGICSAYFDSIPVVFITGQVNTHESKEGLGVRQRGFQETDIVSMVKGVTKYAKKIDRPEDLRWELEHAFYIVSEGRKGPVLLDIPMDIFRTEINPIELRSYVPSVVQKDISVYGDEIISYLEIAERPVILIGQGIKTSNSIELVRRFIHKTKIPVVSTMLAGDVIDDKSRYYGFIGAYGHRTANFVVAKCDVLLTLGARLDVRQVGGRRSEFAPNAKIIRVDIDENELAYMIHQNDVTIHVDVYELLKHLNEIEFAGKYDNWEKVCDSIREKLNGFDDREPNKRIEEISEQVPDAAVVTTDVGQNQVWVAQSFITKINQSILFSGSNGAMGYSLPAAIGAALATGKTVFSFNGDGGIQMNIQELQTIAREKLPIKIIVFNNNALGMIRHFQEMYFKSNYCQTVPAYGYTAPNFGLIAEAYGIPYKCFDGTKKISENIFDKEGAQFIEVVLNEDTYVFPKLEFGKPNQDQEPLLERKFYQFLNDM